MRNMSLSVSRRGRDEEGKRREWETHEERDVQPEKRVGGGYREGSTPNILLD